MISSDEAEQIVEDGGHLVTRDGDDLGPVRRVFLDDYTAWPSFCTVDTDPPSGEEVFVALHEAELDGDRILVPYDLPRIDDAPRAAPDQSLSIADEDALFDYYEVPVEGVQPVVARLGQVFATDED